VSVTVDNEAPTVSITSPAGGATVAGNVSIEASASADVTSVEFFVDGSSIGIDTDIAGGWSVLWQTSTATQAPHDLTAQALDAAGNSTTSPPVTVTVDNPSGPQVFTTAVAVAADDAEQKASGSMNLASADLDMVIDGSTTTTVGLRFTGINIPQNATITNAYIQFRSDEVQSGTTTLTVMGELSPNPAAFGTTKFNITGRADTVSVGWTPVPWTAKNLTGTAQRTPDLKSIVQILVNQGGWQMGNPMVFTIGGTGQRTADSFEGGYAPQLVIEYSTP
jgi:hypothetical protein